jgi:uncharacterized protein YbcI
LASKFDILIATGLIVKIAKKPTIDATNQFFGQTSKKIDLSFMESNVTMALMNIVTNIAENSVTNNIVNKLRFISYVFRKKTGDIDLIPPV